MSHDNSKLVELKNPHLDNLDSDFLYHLGINVANTKNSIDIEKQFGDVKFFLLGGTRGRMYALANHIRSLNIPGVNNKEDLKDLCEEADRYALYKVGPALCCSHGIGMPTFSVLLHELLKLAKYAKCVDPVFLRVGTCGGLGIEAGTVVVTKDAYNGYLRNEHEIAILGEKIVRPATFDEQVLATLLQCTHPNDNFQITEGNTLATECFYEGQGRLDGASCNYTEADKLKFLQKCYNECGIKNIEMEATMFASLTKHVGVRAADVCVALLNRLNGDQVLITTKQKKEYENRPLIVIGRYIQCILGNFKCK